MKGEHKAILIVGETITPSQFHWSGSKAACGRSIPSKAATKFSTGASAETSSMRFRLASPTSTRKTNSRKRPDRRGRRCLRPALHQRARQKGWPLLACSPRRGREPARGAIRRCFARGLPYWSRPVAVSRLLLQDPDQAGSRGARRRRRLCGRRQDDWWICAGGLSCRVPQLGSDELYSQL